MGEKDLRLCLFVSAVCMHTMTSAGDDEPPVDFGDAWAFGASSDTSEAARAAGALEKPRDL
eukprot:1308996-Rhodomonas_salina.1